jgi:hypothetical protein
LRFFFSCARRSPEVASKGFLKTPQGTGYAFARPAVPGFGVAKNNRALEETLNLLVPVPVPGRSRIRCVQLGLHAVASCLLGPIEKPVGAFKQFVHSRLAVRIRRNSNAEARGHPDV